MDSRADLFYNEIAEFYDNMTGFHKRISREKEIMHTWATEYNMQKVLDAACGSGIHSIALNQLGISVTGADISDQMIRVARRNAQVVKSNPYFVKSSFDELENKIRDQFNTVLILGNSLVHILSRTELTQIFAGLKKILTGDGILIIQVLNYHKVLKEGTRIVAINRHDNSEFIRFYDFMHPLLRFNILQIDWNTAKPVYKLSTTKIYPWQRDELESILSESGFKLKDCFGSMQMEEYDEETSGNLVLVINKSP
jgi:2-polyprenyl-3-methyl-5-hydroxy-6-metoxy-1,4-benzoquinol methylase